MFTIFDFAIIDQRLINLLQHSPSLLAAAALSYVVAEFGRDVFHVLGHEVTWFWNNFHRFHHLLYRAGWKVNPNPRIVRLERIRSQLPEGIVMLTSTGLFTVVLAWLNHPWAAIGSLYGLNMTLSNLLRILGEIISDSGHQLDPLHTPSVYTAPPSPSLFVDQPYHDPHHFFDLNSAYSGVFKLIDPILGTSRSLKKSVGLLALESGLTEALAQQLTQAGASVTPLTTVSGGELAEFDILVINGGYFQEAKTFFQSITTNEQIANAELWIFISVGAELAAEMTQIDQDAPVIVRKFYLSTLTSPVWQAKAALFWASRDVRRMIL
ncbi:MAG: sterol desaturase family protein [Synechocystis sp.]|nr:sterol desaturase family protein [Synechocystis sp.]